jgi:hypothetical protein
MNGDLLVEMSDGTLTRKALGDLQPNDRIVFDGPDAFSRLEAAQAALEAEIAVAGGLEAWRAAGRHSYS